MNKKESLLESTASTLEPLVKLLLECGVSQAEFDELSKRVFVKVAESEYQEEGRARITADRVATITGIHRKEVGRLRQRMEGLTEEKRVERNSKQCIVDGWLADNEFCDEPGKPKILEREGDSSFATLVRRYGGDIGIANALKELQRSGLADERDGNVVLLKTSFVPDRLGTERMEHAFRQASKMLNTMQFNLTTKHNKQMFQSAVDNQHIPRTAVKEINKYLHDEGIKFLHQLDAKLSEVQNKKLSKDELCEVTFGIFCNEHPAFRKK